MLAIAHSELRQFLWKSHVLVLDPIRAAVASGFPHLFPVTWFFPRMCGCTAVQRQHGRGRPRSPSSP